MIDVAKKYTYQNCEFRVYATDGGGPTSDYRIHGAYKNICGEWLVTAVAETDLVEVKAERTLWLNVYRDSTDCLAYTYTTKELAGRVRIACVKVTFREGDGLA